MEIVCLETTFFSFYYDARPAPAIVAMCDWTKQFWNARRNDYDFVTSVAVLDELRKGGAHHKIPALNLALTVPIVPSGDEVAEIVRAYVYHKIMPEDPAGDALHLANANKFGHIRQVNAILGLRTPELVTPPELMGELET